MRTIRIDLLSPTPTMVVWPPPPDGVRMGGLQSEPTNGPIGDSLFLIVEVAGKIAPGILARWIYDRVVQYDAKRKAINGREVVGESDFHRVITEELEIGKND